MFSFYMRDVLTPLALLTWANLNHSLCGTDSDPVWLHFELGKWYYLLGEGYLWAACFAFIVINSLICHVFKRWIFCDKSTNVMTKALSVTADEKDS